MAKSPLRKTNEQAPATVNESYTKRRYVPFYLTMLILSTIGTSVSVIGIFGLQETITNLPTAPVFYSAAIISTLAWIVSVVGLIFLWQKNPLGIQLKLTSYAVQFVATAASLVTIRPFLTEIIDTAVREGKGEISRVMAEQVVTGIVFVVYGLSLVMTALFAFLWYKAWQSQSEEDTSPNSK